MLTNNEMTLNHVKINSILHCEISMNILLNLSNKVGGAMFLDF
jgi:hypothetical protein